VPVVINDFQVVVDQPPPEQTRSAASEAAQPSALPRGATPHEVENILRREKERLARVMAH
jgi:hypothetical protein